MRTNEFLRAVAALLALGVGCSGGNSNGGAAPAGRGSPACNQWQAALCNWIAQCPSTGATCDQIKGITCKSDGEAQRCANALASPTCASFPASCDLQDLADPAPAQKACDDFETAVCQRSEECSAGTRDACLQDAKSKLNCSNVFGFTLAYEQCMSLLPTAACDASSPDVCKGILLTKQ